MDSSNNNICQINKENPINKKKSNKNIIQNNTKEPSSKYIYLFILFILGTINNIGYVLVWVSSSDLSKHLNSPNLEAMYMLMVLTFSAIGRFLTMKFLIKVSYKTKTNIVSILMITGYLSFFFILIYIGDSKSDSKKGFYISLAPTSLIGLSTSIGELNLVCYLKKYPSTWLSGFYGGTGMAGVAGAVISILFTIFKTKSSLMWLFMSINGVIYWCAFNILEYFYNKNKGLLVLLTNEDIKISNIKNKESLIEAVTFDENLNLSENLLVNNYETIKNTNTNNSIDIVEQYRAEKYNNDNNITGKIKSKSYDKLENIAIDNDNVVINKRKVSNELNLELSFDNLKKVYSLCSYYIFNIGLCYFFGYMAVHFCSRYGSLNYISIDNQYMYYNLSYQIGVIISRSSVSIIRKIKKLWLFTIIEFVLMTLWFLLSIYGFIAIIWVLLVITLIVGLIEGASYVYGYYLIYEDKTIDNRLRELCLNISFNTNDFFLISTTLISLILDNTILKV